MKYLGMVYEAIDACPNDHIIYYGQHATNLDYSQCGISSYQTNQVTNKVPHKFLHHIPILSRFQQLIRCKSMAQFMDYHAKNRSEDDVLRIPVDGSTLKNIKEKW